MTRRRRGALLMGLALALGGVAASDVGRREAAVRAQLAPLVDVVVAGRDLPPRRRLATSDLALRRIPARYAPGGAASVPEEVVGRRLSSAAPRGAYLGAGLIVDDSAPAPAGMRKGERAVEVAGAGSPELVVAGARVDVVVVPERGGARLALAGAQVLAARPLAAAAGAEEGPGPPPAGRRGRGRGGSRRRDPARHRPPGAHRLLAHGRRPRGAVARTGGVKGGESPRAAPSGDHDHASPRPQGSRPSWPRPRTPHRTRGGGDGRGGTGRGPARLSGRGAAVMDAAGRDAALDGLAGS